MRYSPLNVAAVSYRHAGSVSVDDDEPVELQSLLRRYYTEEDQVLACADCGNHYAAVVGYRHMKSAPPVLFLVMNWHRYCAALKRDVKMTRKLTFPVMGLEVPSPFAPNGGTSNAPTNGKWVYDLWFIFGSFWL